MTRRLRQKVDHVQVSDDGRREQPEPPAPDRNLGVDRERETPYIRPRP